MSKIEEIIIGTNNAGKSREICSLLPKKIKKYFPKEFNILSPKETGKSFEENSFIKASYFSKKTNLICLSDDSGLEIDLLKGRPGIYSARWGGINNDFDLAIKKVFSEFEVLIESSGDERLGDVRILKVMPHKANISGVEVRWCSMWHRENIYIRNIDEAETVIDMNSKLDKGFFMEIQRDLIKAKLNM